MSTLDLALIRAQLRAASEDRRAPPRGPFRCLRGLLSPRARPSLLGEAPPYSLSPVAPCTVWDTEDTLLLSEPIDVPVRRDAFGIRSEAGGVQVSIAQSRGPAMLIDLSAQPDRVDAIRRRPSSLLRRLEDAEETPFLPEDLTDAASGEVERIYSEAGLAKAARPANSLLLGLEQRLLEERLFLIGVIAGRTP
jgi:hypothetical protein